MEDVPYLAELTEPIAKRIETVATNQAKRR